MAEVLKGNLAQLSLLDILRMLSSGIAPVAWI